MNIREVQLWSSYEAMSAQIMDLQDGSSVGSWGSTWAMCFCWGCTIVWSFFFFSWLSRGGRSGIEVIGHAFVCHSQGCFRLLLSDWCVLLWILMCSLCCLHLTEGHVIFHLWNLRNRPAVLFCISRWLSLLQQSSVRVHQLNYLDFNSGFNQKLMVLRQHIIQKKILANILYVNKFAGNYYKLG